VIFPRVTVIFTVMVLGWTIELLQQLLITVSLKVLVCPMVPAYSELKCTLLCTQLLSFITLKREFIFFSDSVSSLKALSGFKLELDLVQSIIKDYIHLTNNSKQVSFAGFHVMLIFEAMRGLMLQLDQLSLCQLHVWNFQHMKSSLLPPGFVWTSGRIYGAVSVPFFLSILFFTGSIARSANLPVLNLLRGRFWGFLPRRGDTLHRLGWNLAWRRGPKVPSSFGPLLHAKFHPHRCNEKGVGPPKLKFLLRFDRNVKYKRPVGAYPLRDFHKSCTVCTPF